MLKCIIFQKSMYKFSKENVYSKMFFFLSHKYLKENVFTKIFNDNVYI